MVIEDSLVIDAETWAILAARLDQICVERARLAAQEDPTPELVFDIHDQAMLKR